MSRIDDARSWLAKQILGRPQGISDAQAAQGMNNTAALGPGTPLIPADGYSQTPRRMDYPVGVNLNQSGRQAWGRTSFETLDALIDAYSPARSAMNHKIDELKSMELLFNPVDGFEGDAEDAIAAAKLVLSRPDRVLPWEEWLSLFMEGMLRYDAGVLYKRRNMAGEVIALEVIDGSTVFPFIDEFGRRPIPPAPSYFQRIHGQVWNEFTTDNVDYFRFRPQLKSPFGLAPMESVLLSVNTDLRQQWNLLQMFTEGSVPAGFMTLPPDISSPQQVQQWQEYWDSFVLGDQSMLHKMIVIPNGSEFKNTTPQKFDPLFPQYLERLTYAAFQVVPQDLGATMDVNRATGESQTDIQFRVNTLPWVRFIEGFANRYLQTDIGLPVKVNLNTGRDSEDSLQEAQRWQVLVSMAAASPDEARQELTGLPIDNERPTPRGFFSTKSGFQPLVSALSVSGPIDPETGAPTHDAPLNIAPVAPAPGNPDPLPVQAGDDPDTVQKDDGGATAGVTTATGIAGLDLIEDEDEKIVKELAQFRTFKRGRINKGSWRDFEFVHLTKAEGETLNNEARASFPKVRAVSKAATGSWRTMLPKVPQHNYDIPLTDYYAPKVQDALAEYMLSFNVASIISGVVVKSEKSDAVKAQIVAALTAAGVAATALAALFRSMYADGWVAGQHAATVQLGSAAVSPLPTIVSETNWDAWTPGNADAALKDADGGLKVLLDQADIQIKSVQATSIDQLGNVISQGVANGDAPATIGRSIRDFVDTGGNARADLIANAESTRAIMAATTDTYTANGVTKFDVIVSDGCNDFCLDVAAGGPYFVGDEDNTPQLHLYCRCAASPDIDSIEAANIQTVEPDGSPTPRG